MKRNVRVLQLEQDATKDGYVPGCPCLPILGNILIINSDKHMQLINRLKKSLKKYA